MSATPPSSHAPVAESAAEFDRLLRPLIPVLFRQAFRWTMAVDQAEDLVQELLLRLYPRRDELAALDRLQPWALRVMYRIFVDQYRRSRNSPVRPLHELPTGHDTDAGDPGEQFADPGAQPAELVERELTAARLSAALAELNEDQRVVVAMHDIEGYRLEEIATLLDTPVGTLKSRLHRARARLRELLGPWFHPTEPFAPDVRASGQETKQ